ncbi:hypothetical protein FNV43_RR26325 [Rhamnella rubrinervis]|uniref:Asparagine synthetase domain-containing protein 1 n=1 Tax=Rhamnella rubrinervis TaxID=2594499 RepID=A0A8K0DNV4_9ROSA|nr:hypothetical protein FNV43_RR26325 [Rhamnella rubrinervis]
MCGIALIISGIRLELSTLILHSTPQPHSSEQLVFSIDDLKAALRRRGPDSLESKKLLLQPSISCLSEVREILSFVEGQEAVQREIGQTAKLPNYAAELHFIGATLQLRGVNPIVQPLIDTSRNILVYNGEIYGGLHVGSDENDAQILMQTLEKCCSCNSHLNNRICHCDEREQLSVVNVLSTVKGPWAIIYWQESAKTLWFGRDAFGRRSLLVHWPTVEDPRFLLSSVSPNSSVEQSSDFESEHGITNIRFWDELPCGVYSITVAAPDRDGFMVGEVKKHEWTDAMLEELIKWERNCVEPKPEELLTSCLPMQASVSVAAQTLLSALRESVRRRSSLHTIFQADIQKELAPVAILFSGGLDSMILAALLHECLDISYEIDLLNVSFDEQSAPDRISAKVGVEELRRISPSRKWKLVEIDSDLSKLTLETNHVMSLINPANTYMDLNIGIALWLAAGGNGWLYEGHSNFNNEDYRHIKYRSKARILLVGSGADEQCAGYGRHRTKFRQGSWLGLHEEMKLDMQRIWKRNLGRDDRCIADNGREARFPFLDEDVIKALLDIPLWEIADLNQPSGAGDKKILREVAQLLGLYEAAALPKRAIQFGSRIARESNRKNFGSNRAANQASAGTMDMHLCDWDDEDDKEESKKQCLCTHARPCFQLLASVVSLRGQPSGIIHSPVVRGPEFE